MVDGTVNVEHKLARKRRSINPVSKLSDALLQYKTERINAEN